MRRRLELPRELWIQNFGGSWCRSAHCQAPCLYASTDGSRRACGVGACTCIVPTLGDPRETSGPRIDRIPPARPPWRDCQYREIKKIFFSPLSKCPIDLFGPVANRTILIKVHAASRSSSRNPRRTPPSTLPQPANHEGLPSLHPPPLSICHDPRHHDPPKKYRASRLAAVQVRHTRHPRRRLGRLKS